MSRTTGCLVLALSFLTGCTGVSSSPADPAPPPATSPGSSVAAADLPPPDPREVRLAATVVRLLEAQHLRRRKVDDELSRLAYDRYIEQLDPGKMFLLQADVTALAGHAATIDDQLKSGRLTLAHEGAARFQQRREVVEAVVADLLSKPFDAADEELVETDADKMEPAATEAALRERWRQRLELEVLERVAVMEERAKALAESGAGKGKGKGKLASNGHGHGKGAGKGKGNASGKGKAMGGSTAGPSAATGAAIEEDASGDGIPPLSADQIPPTLEGREAKARADMAKSYAGRFHRMASPPALDAATALINAVGSAFDPHTNYLPPSDKANFDIQMTGSLEGIGAVLREDDRYIRVVEIVPGGASWRQGELEAGDLILSVQQDGKEPVDTADMRIDDVVKLIRGKKGTVVTLSIQKPTTEIKTLSITRDIVVIEAAYARGAVLQRKGDRRSLGYIYLPSFYGGQSGARSASGDVRRLLLEMSKRKVAGVVIDVRGNGGGLLDDARVMTGLLIDQGPVVQTQVTDGDREILTDDDPGLAYAGPVVVMVDRFSASASEILAGAVQDYRRGVIVGTGPTHGKGTVQVLADLDRMGGGGDKLGVLKLTVQQFFRVSGASTQWQGVVPDVQLPDPVGYLETGERTLDNSIPWSQIDPLPHDDWSAGWQLEKVVAGSQARQAKHDAFGKITRQTELLRARREETKVPLARAAWQALRDKRRAELEAVSPDLDEGPARFSVTLVDYDGAAPVAARPGGKADDRGTRWADSLARDPYVEESLLVLGDMVGGR